MSDGILLPWSVLDELALEAEDLEMQRSIEYARLQEDPVNFLGIRSGGFIRPSLGNQPPAARLLNEGIAGWSSTAGTAVAQRMSGLADHLEVGEKTTDERGRDTIEPIQNHIIKQMIAAPNPIFSMPDMLWVLAWHLQQTGIGYWQILKDGLGMPIELWPLLPQHVEIVSNRETIIGGYQVTDADGGQLFRQARPSAG